MNTLKKVILSLTFITICYPNNNYVLKGYIYDSETGYAIPGVQIFLSDSSKGIVTDNSGYFMMSGLSKTNEIRFDHIKYHSIARNINFDKGREYFNSYYLYSKNLEMDSVLVWGNAFFPGRNDKTIDEKENFLWTKSYKQYRQMLKRGNWSWTELVAYGLWSLADQQVFNDFWELKTKSHREIFLDKFWFSVDPTPNTSKNEFREEFERRVRFNWTHFSQVDTSGIRYENAVLDSIPLIRENLNTFKGESVYKLRPWTKRAPWDARGEIYLKYGLPDEVDRLPNRTIFSPTHPSYQPIEGSGAGEEFTNWAYHRLGIDFYIKKYNTNIFGKAIFIGQERSENLFDKLQVQGDVENSNYYKSITELDTIPVFLETEDFKINYIDNRDFYYQYKKQDTIANFNFSLVKSPYDSQKVFLNFDFVPEYFRSIKNETLYSLVSIDYRIIDKKSGDLILEKSSKKFRTNKRPEKDILKMSLLLQLTDGEYNIHLKVEDHNGNRIAEKNIEFIIDSNKT